MSLLMSDSLEGLVNLDVSATKGKGLKASLSFEGDKSFEVIFVGFGFDKIASIKNLVIGIDSAAFRHIYCGSSLEYFDAFENRINLKDKIINFSIDRNENSHGCFATLILEIEE